MDICTKVYKQIIGSTINKTTINTADYVQPTPGSWYPLPTTLRLILFHNSHLPI